MSAIGWDTWRVLAGIFGKKVSRVRLILFEYQGEYRWNGGDLDLLLDDNHVCRFAGAHGGAVLEVHSEEWVDDTENLSDSDRTEYIQQYGKMSLVDVSNKDPYSSL